MPAVSEKQRRAMYAAAEGNSTLGIPEKVGKEFVKKDGVSNCAGLLLRNGNRFLLVKRVENGLWEQPGGHIESGESAKEAAVREADEEAGPIPNGDTKRIKEMRGPAVNYTTFLRDVPEFTPTLSEEHTDWEWFSIDNLPPTVHPEVRATIEALGVKKDAVATDYDLAKGMRDGDVCSPQKIGDAWLFDMRITGTGAAYRSAHDEYAFRDPGVWLSDDFVERCNGLPVIFEHPDSSTLTTDEYRQRAIGTIIMPYIKGEEVWGIAKIFDDDAAELMQTSHTSTSPGVMAGQDSQTVNAGGTDVLVESAPLIFDHLAVCNAGVWDKGGPPMGIRLDAESEKKEGEKKYGDVKFADPDNDKYPIDTDEHIRAAWNYIHKEKDADKYSAEDLAAIKKRIVAAWKDKIDPEGPPEAKDRKDADMADEKEARKDAEPDFAMLMDAIGKMNERMDAMEKSRADAEGEEEKHKAGEEAAKAAEERAKMDKKDSEDEDEKSEEKEAKKDADESEDGDKDAKKDAVHMKNMEKELAALKARMASVTREPTFEDREAISAAYRRADSIYQMHGRNTPEAGPGESPIAYRKRLAHGLKRYSKTYGEYKLDSVGDDQTFSLVENAIYADADNAARSPENMQPGRLVPHVTNSNGHNITRFYGDAAAAWRLFQPPMVQQGRFNTEMRGN